VVEFLIPCERSPVLASARDQILELKVGVAAALTDMVIYQLLTALTVQRVDPHGADRPKMRTVTTLAAKPKSEIRHLDLTPDLLPSDITHAKIADA
jgi:hypothetical protein